MSTSLVHHSVAEIVILLRHKHDFKTARNYCKQFLTGEWTCIRTFDEPPVVEWYFENANEALHFKLKFSGSTS